MGLFFLGAVLGGIGAAKRHADERRRRREAEAHMRAEREERLRQLEHEREANREATRKQERLQERVHTRRRNRYLFSPSGGIGLGTDENSSELGVIR